MTAFVAAIDSLFADPNIAQDAVYVATAGTAIPVRVIARRPDAVSDFAGGRIASATAVFDLRFSDVATPRPGDRIELDGDAFLVQGEPRRDAQRLVWSLDTRPA